MSISGKVGITDINWHFFLFSFVVLLFNFAVLGAVLYVLMFAYYNLEVKNGFNDIYFSQNLLDLKLSLNLGIL